jgi:WD40 repeat protein
LLAVIACGCSRNHPQTETAAAAAMPPQLPAIEFAGAWGVRGDQPGQLEQPVGLAADAAGRIYVADRSTGFVQKFEAGGTNLLTFEDAAARGAAAITVDSGGGIYVANARAGEISVFFPEGDLLRVFHVAPQRNFEGPYGFSVGADGRLFVPDPAGGKIAVLSSRGRLEKTWNVATAMAVPREQARPVIAVAGADGFVYVGDARTGRIVKLIGAGEPSPSWRQTAADSAPLLALAISPKYLFALRSASPRLQVWSLNGELRLSDDLGGRLSVMSSEAPAAGSAASREGVSRGIPPGMPASMAVSPRGELFILDPSVPRVLRFRIHLDPS